MNGLLTKDFLVIKRRYSLFYGIAVVVFLVGVFILFPQQAAIFVPVLLAPFSIASLAELAISDEKSGWKNYLPGLPLTRKEIVLSRYAFCGVLIAVTSIIGFIYGGLAVLVFRNWRIMDVLLASFGGLLFGLLMMMIGVPSSYFCKGDVATASMMGIMFLAMIVRYSGIVPVFLAMNLWIVIPIILIALLVLAIVSFHMSVLIYTQKIRLKDKGMIR